MDDVNRLEIEEMRRARANGALEQQSRRGFLGDGNGRINVAGRKGYVYVRYISGSDSNGNATYGAPVHTRFAMGAVVTPQHGATVYVKKGASGHDEVVEGDWEQAIQAGINPAATNPLNKESIYHTTDSYIPLLSLPVATETTASLKVTTQQWLYDNDNGDLVFFNPQYADQLSLASLIPAAGYHRYIVVWLDTYTNTLSATASTSTSMFTALTTADILECDTTRPADSVPLKAYYLANNPTTLRADYKHVDLRQMINTPNLLGHENTIGHNVRVWPLRTWIVSDITLSATGNIELIGEMIAI